MANFHEEQAKMDDYGYGQDRVDNTLVYGYSAPGQEGEVIKEGEVKKKRGPARDFLNRICSDVNYDLLVSKLFYFFFFAAFGSLFPLIGVYFKQLGMNPAQAGMLIGFRPFVELVAGPFWGNVAERWKKWKTVLLFSLLCWIVFTLALAFVQPPANACLVHNGTDILVAKPYTISNLPFADMDVLGGKRVTRSDSFAAEGGDPLGKKTEGKRYLYEPYWLPIGRVKRAPKVDAPQQPGPSEGKDDKEKPKDDDDDDDNDDEDKNDENDDDNDDDDDDKGKDKEATAPRRKEVKAPKHHSPRPQHLYQFRQFPFPIVDKVGLSPLPLNHKHVANLNAAESKYLVSPPLSAVVYRIQDIQGIFLELLVLQILGEFLSTPALTMADTATLGYLEDDIENYGRQRMYGSFGWAISMYFVGIALDHSNVFPNHPCGTEHLVDRNYMTCYAVFTVLMCCAFLTATQFRFKEVDSSFNNIPLSELRSKVVGKVQQTLTQLNRKENHPPAGTSAVTQGVPPDGQQKVQISLHDDEGRVVTGDMISDVHATPEERPVVPAPAASPYVPRGKPGQAGTLPQWVTVLKMFAPLQFSAMFFILWYMGFGIGLVFAFLFWHLQDLHGSPTLFGISSVINHVSEIMAYFFIRKLVAKFGHVNVIYAGLIGNVVRFIYISYLKNPWWVLPFEFVQGLTHAAVWAAGCSYMTQGVPVAHRPTAQMILQSLHHAFGRGCGTIFGGALINSYGTESVFRAYGISCIFVVVGYFALNFFYLRHLPPIIGAPQPTNEIDPETAYLTPHGVPGGGIPHSLSNSRLDKAGDGPPQYGAPGPSNANGYFEPGGPSPNQNQGYGRGGGPSTQYNQKGGMGPGGDYQYGYDVDVDPTMQNGRVILNNNENTKSTINSPEYNEPGLAAIQKKFQAYEEAVTMSELQRKPAAQRLILHMAPKPLTQAVLEQPENRDLSLTEDSTGNWLY